MDKEQIHKWWWAEEVAGGEGGRRRRKQAEKEAGLSLLTTVSKPNEELITRMENSLQQLKNELQNKLRNPSLGDTDKQLWTLFVHKTLEQLEPNTEARVAEREKRKTPPSPQQAPQKTNFLHTHIYVHMHTISGDTGQNVITHHMFATCVC